MLTGPLIFIGPLTVGRASDSQRGPVFLAGPDGQRGPTALTCFFVGYMIPIHVFTSDFRKEREKITLKHLLKRDVIVADL